MVGHAHREARCFEEGAGAELDAPNDRRLEPLCIPFDVVGDPHVGLRDVRERGGSSHGGDGLLDALPPQRQVGVRGDDAVRELGHEREIPRSLSREVDRKWARRVVQGAPRGAEIHRAPVDEIADDSDPAAKRSCLRARLAGQRHRAVAGADAETKAPRRELGDRSGGGSDRGRLAGDDVHDARGNGDALGLQCHERQRRDGVAPQHRRVRHGDGVEPGRLRHAGLIDQLRQRATRRDADTNSKGRPSCFAHPYPSDVGGIPMTRE